MYGRVEMKENTHDGSICYQKRRTLVKITTEVRNTYILMPQNHISGGILPIPTNSTQIQLITGAISSLKYVSRQYPTR